MQAVLVVFAESAYIGTRFHIYGVYVCECILPQYTNFFSVVDTRLSFYIRNCSHDFHCVIFALLYYKIFSALSSIVINRCNNVPT